MKTDNISLSSNEKIALISNLATMLSAGIPILESIDSLLDGAKGNQKKILDTLKDDLISGKRVYMTMTKFPRVFDKVTVNIIKASEEAGVLDVTLKDLVAIIKKDIEFNDKIKSALVYPVFILVVFIGVLLMILVVVVPKIATVFSRLTVDLPLPTRILIFLSDLVLKNTIPLILVIAAIVSIFVYLYKKNRKAVLGALFSLPYVSKLAREIDLTRFSRSLYLLLTAGIPIANALELTHEVVMKKEVAKAIDSTKEIVISGKKISEGFKSYKHIFPTIMIKITEAGEKSGSLDKSMQEVSDYLDYQVSNSIRLVTSLIEPIMLVFVGGMIGGMMLAIIAPIYGLIGQVGAR
jgi:type II secretory pathway component PulF